MLFLTKKNLAATQINNYIFKIYLVKQFLWNLKENSENVFNYVNKVVILI